MTTGHHGSALLDVSSVPQLHVSIKLLWWRKWDMSRCSVWLRLHCCCHSPIYKGRAVWSHFDWFSDIRHYNTTSCGLRSFVVTPQLTVHSQSLARTGRDQELRWWHPFSLHNQIPSQHQIFVISLSFRYRNVRNIPVLVGVLWRCLYTATRQTLRHREEEEEEERGILKTIQ